MNLNSHHFPRIYNAMATDEKLLTISEVMHGVQVDTYFESDEAPKDSIQLEERLLDMLLPLLDAIDQLHKLGLVHSNINVSTLQVLENRFVLKDMPLYLLYSGERCRPSYPDYAYTQSPEFLRGEQSTPSPAEDLWAIGVLLFRILCKTYPWHRKVVKDT